MKTRVVVIVLVIVVLAIGIWMQAGSAPALPAQLLPAWQLLKHTRYTGEEVCDPFASWSPDSKALLFSEHSKQTRNEYIFKWDVGEKRLKMILTGGRSPNYLGDATSFIYMNTGSSKKAILKYNFATGKAAEAIPNINKDEFWKQALSVGYNSKDKTLDLRLCEFTPRPPFAGERCDINGNSLGDIKREKGPEVVDYSETGDGAKCASVVQRENAGQLVLELVENGRGKAKQIDTGKVGAVAWSPDGKLLAYGYATELRLMLENGKRLVIGRFAEDHNNPLDPYVARLLWSPNGQYLAVLVMTPNQYSDQPKIFVLDMSALKVKS